MSTPPPTSDDPLCHAPDYRLKAQTWFQDLRDQIVITLEQIEADYAQSALIAVPATFQKTTWERPDGGGGTMALMRGNVFEKVGVNISLVSGTFSSEFQSQIPGTEGGAEFWASGVSFVAHPRSPHVPAAHMNTRHIVTRGKRWFGGGADMTPYFPVAADTQAFHAALKAVCDAYRDDAYTEYKAWCDRYFYLPHRQEPRGVGGIFYDYVHSGEIAQDFLFTQEVGRAFNRVYPEIVRKRMARPWTPEDRAYQLQRRGRYVEFNLLYDRGTLFGLKTGGNTEAILMSLPPEVTWP